MKRTFNHIADQYRTETRGNVAVMFAISIFFLIGCLAIAVDGSNAFFAKQRLQDTTDAVALMAAKDKTLDTKVKITEAAQALYDATYPDQEGVRIQVQNVVRVGDAVTVTTKNNIDTYFTGIFNRKDMDIGVVSTAIYTKKSMDVTLVLDTTGSMGWPVNGKSGPSKLNGLKVAANGLIDTFDDMNNDNLRLSIVPFGHYTNVGAVRRKSGWIDFSGADKKFWNGCVGSRENGHDESPLEAGGAIPAFSNITCGAEVMPLTKNMNNARRSIKSLKPQGWTYVPSGVVWGWRTLEGELPIRISGAPKNATHKKVMVIMTDGENTRSKSGLTHESKNISEANDKTTSLCNKVKADDIEIYTITYALDDKTTKNLMRNCATNPSMFFDAKSASELKQAFDAIGRNLEVLRTTA